MALPDAHALQGAIRVSVEWWAFSYKQMCAKIAQEPQILPNVTNPQNVFFGAIMSQTLAHETPGFLVMKGSYHHSSFDSSC